MANAYKTIAGNSVGSKFRSESCRKSKQRTFRIFGFLTFCYLMAFFQADTWRTQTKKNQIRIDCYSLLYYLRLDKLARLSLISFYFTALSKTA